MKEKILFEDPDKEDKNDKRRTEVQMQYLRKRSGGNKGWRRHPRMLW